MQRASRHSIVIVSAAILIAVLCFAALAEVTPASQLIVAGGTGEPGDIVQVAVALNNDSGAVVTVDLDLGFPVDAVEIATPITASCTVTERLSDSHQVGGQLIAPGVLRLAVFARGLEVLPIGNGDVVTCAFHILPSAALGTAPLGIQFAGLGDASGQLLPVEAVSGAIAIGAAPPTATPIEPTPVPPTPTTAVRHCAADCNGDGEVTIDEIIRGVGIGLGNLPLAECPASDPDQDGAVSISELIKGVNGAMGNCPF